MSKNLKEFFKNREVENSRLDSKISQINKGRWNGFEDDDEESEALEAPQSQVVALPEEEAAETPEATPEAPVETPSEEAK